MAAAGELEAGLEVGLEVGLDVGSEMGLEVGLVVDMTGLAAAQAAQLLEASNNDVSLAVALFFGEE